MERKDGKNSKNSEKMYVKGNTEGWILIEMVDKKFCRYLTHRQKKIEKQTDDDDDIRTKHIHTCTFIGTCIFIHTYIHSFIHSFIHTCMMMMMMMMMGEGEERKSTHHIL